MVILTAMNFKESSGALEKTYITSLTEVNESVTSMVEMSFNGYELGLIQTSMNGNVKAAATKDEDDQWLLNVLKSYTETYSQSLMVYIGLEDGRFISYPSVELPEDYDARMRDWYTSAMESDCFIWTDVYVDAIGKTTVTGAIPVYDNNNQRIGVLATDMALSGISKGISTIRVGDNGYVFAVNPEGKMIAHSDESLLGSMVPVEEIRLATT